MEIATASDPLVAGLLELPDAQKALQTVDALAAGHARFAAMLDAGVTPAEALTRLGLQLFQDQQFRDAAAIFRLAVALAPANPVTWTNYGTALDRAGSLAEAAMCLEHSLQLVTDQPDTWLLLGLVRKKLGDLNGCEMAYRVALEQAPESSSGWQCLALLKNEQRDYVEAIECFRQAINSGAADASISANLGKLYYEVGRIPEACEAYEQAVARDAQNAHYRQMLRKARFLSEMIEGAPADRALAAYEASLPSPDGETENDRKDLLQAAFGQLSGFGHIEAAKQVGAKYLEMWPGDEVVEYLMKALDGETLLERSPSGYVAEYFDSFAETFDTKLVDVLGYDVPAKIFSLIRSLTPANHRYEAVDVGCGTGLCGPLLLPIAGRLTGVDLSPKMLARAGKRGVYDELVCEEVTSYLQGATARFDLVIAADVIVYIGDLQPIFAAAAKAMRPGGLFAFSTELWTGEKYRLQPTGRFCHETQYVRLVAKQDFDELFCTETTIRLEGSASVPGNLFVFRRRAS